MREPEVDRRTDWRKNLDEQIAAEPELAPVELPSDFPKSSAESLVRRHHRRPLAISGVVENGLVRPLDPDVILAEHSRVIIVTAE